ncbi:MAG: ATP-binding cassette domain-containing protein [Candidatus Electrothrix sp. LOE1_4_5]|nr:ATP-binding cassette domain-containing protein [Candidatus Electrothrix gigas]
MSSAVIKIENLWKEYRLGVIGHGTLTHDLQSWWAKMRGKEDPNAKITPILAGQEKQIEGDRFWALRDINLEVKEGEILGIIGKNGAGKSTLLKILSRVTAPTKGNIKVKGRIASLLEVGTGFHPELTGRENIFMNGAILGMSKQEIRDKLDEIIDFSGVENFIDTPVKRYSSGMYVRLAFAVAAHLEPEILVVDEVLAVGDIDFQKKCMGKMKQVSGQGRTVFFVSHNMAAVKKLCDTGVVLGSGKIKFSGTAEESVSYYLNTSESKCGIPLIERNDREGNQKLKVTDCYFMDYLENRTDRLISGSPVKLIVEYIQQEHVEPKDIFFGITFYDDEHVIQTVIVNDELGYKFTELNGRLTIDIKRNIFRAGSYHYTIFVGLKTCKRAKPEKVDIIEYAGRFIVSPGDFWGSGVINRPKGFIQDARMY